jgi:hypothetical protein
VPLVLDGPAVLDLKDHVRRLYVGDEVEHYVVALADATRRHPQIQLGASPRATVALYRAAQAWAFIDGRDFVRPDDVKAIAPAVLAHRIVIDLDQGLRGATAEGVLDELLASVPVPPLPDGAMAASGASDAAATAPGRTADGIAGPETSGSRLTTADEHDRYRHPREAGQGGR